ncbi:hypothetical protein RND81_03G065400 [Saponaria officinalis]|uniref:Retrotransposon Copia-like N-terminal domain-containing protein n=1 Tax=Saponaria officinalis TaxID=3572 RepID=A0AAW1M626_SAPOF
MTGETNSSNNSRIFDDPYFLSHGDIPAQQLISVQFNGKNYANWSRSVKRALAAKNKLSFVTGDLPKPDEKSKDCQKWLQVDFTVSSWILNSIVSSLSQEFNYVHSSKQLWDDLKEQYGQSDGTMHYEIGKELYNLQQGNLSISEYYGKMRRLWEDLLDIEGYPECSCGILEKCTCNLLKKVVDAENRRRLIQFLMGADSAYDQIKQLLLAQDPLPTINHALSRLIQAERQRKFSDFAVMTEESSALLVHKNYQSPVQKQFSHNMSYQQNKDQRKDYRDTRRIRGTLYCKYCKKDNHDIENCYRLKNKEKYNQNTRFSGGPSGNRFAAYAVEDKMNEPLEFEDDHRAGSQGASQANPVINEDYIMSIVQKAMKGMGSQQQFSDKTSSDAMLNFAGPYN